jgi:ubiquinone/menaquinone biosynthesis C-methylase UbiE
MGFADPKRNIEQFQLEPGMDVADFGAGAGYLAVEAAEVVGKEGTVYVVDIQRELLTKATHLAQEQQVDTITFIRGDIEEPNGSTLPDESVDAVIISNLLFQVENKQAVVEEAHRVLKNGGRALIVDWRESFGGVGPQADAVLHEDDARALLEEQGFEHLADIDAGAYHYGIIVRKHGR